MCSIMDKNQDCPHFAGEETEIQRGSLLAPESCGWERSFESRSGSMVLLVLLGRPPDLEAGWGLMWTRGLWRDWLQ